jgi:hypothetical protein
MHPLGRPGGTPAAADTATLWPVRLRWATLRAQGRTPPLAHTRTLYPSCSQRAGFVRCARPACRRPPAAAPLPPPPARPGRPGRPHPGQL